MCGAAGKDPVTNLTDHIANPWIANFTTNSASPNLHCTDTVVSEAAPPGGTARMPSEHTPQDVRNVPTHLFSSDAGLSLPFQNAVQAPFENHIGAFP